MLTVSKIEKVISSYQPSIASSGYRSISLRSLLRDFGYKKRGPKNLQLITEALETRKLYIQPALSMDMSFNSSLKISDFNERVYGDLFEKERDLESFIVKHKVLETLDISYVSRQYSPNSSPTRIDILGRDKDGRDVVIELKKDRIHGYVTQLLEYADLLQQQKNNRKIRKVLITGVLDRKTAHAFNAFNRLEREYSEWYVYKFEKEKNKLELIQVTHYQITQLLKNNQFASKRDGKAKSIKPGTYKDLDEKLIEVIGEACEHERDQTLIVYREKSKKDLRIMTKQEFNEEVLISGKWRPRFRLMKK